jgi:DNA primase
MNNSYIANEIKSRVKMPELVRFYGFEIKRGNRIPCHIHGGKNDNLGIKEEYCHCFKCGYNADAIKFVQDYFSLSFADAVSKINMDFSLGLPIGERIDKRRQTDMARQSFLQKQEQKKKEEEHEKYEGHEYGEHALQALQRARAGLQRGRPVCRVYVADVLVLHTHFVQ